MIYRRPLNEISIGVLNSKFSVDVPVARNLHHGDRIKISIGKDYGSSIPFFRDTDPTFDEVLSSNVVKREKLSEKLLPLVASFAVCYKSEIHEFQDNELKGNISSRAFIQSLFSDFTNTHKNDSYGQLKAIADEAWRKRNNK